MTFQRMVAIWHLKGRLIEFETDIGGPQCKETLNPIALVVMPANVEKLHTTEHRYQQVMFQ